MDQSSSAGDSGSADLTPAVVVAHGLWMTGAETWLLRRRLARQGFVPYLFRYHTVGEGLAANADAMAEFIRNLAERPVHIVGYSLGGVVALEMMQRHGISGVGRVVCVGSPLKGSATGRMLVGKLGGKRLVGKSILELNARGGLGPWQHSSVEVGVIAGSLPAGIGRAIGALGRASDGTVAVDETRLQGAADHVVRPQTHTSLLFSAAVAADIVHFLKHGRF
jgi:pimeloyl-ACP methyl ester carboxylesterase